MVNYDIKERPRCSGKTAELKLRFLEDALSEEYDFQVVIAHNQNYVNEFMKWGNDHKIYHHSHYKICYNQETLDNCLRGVNNQKIAVYIDEPFIMSDFRQTHIIDTLSMSGERNNIDVFGIGTRPEYTPQTFSDLIKD